MIDLTVFIQPPLLVSYLACMVLGWGTSEPGWRKLPWIGAALGIWAIAFLMIFMGVRW